ncbi:MAG: hypothetical protein R3A80_12330 [Bdellovibrionota bacterium]
MNQPIRLSPNDTTQGNHEWRKLLILLKKFEALINQMPASSTTTTPSRIRVFSHLDTKSQFLSLPLEFQQKAVLAFQFYVETISAMIKAGEAPTNSKRFLWRALQSLALIPLDNVFSQISDDDIIEVYSSEGIQIFRSFSFLETISYTIEDLIVFPWHDLFTRDEKITELLIDQAVRLFNREIEETRLNEINYNHKIFESKSLEKRILLSRFGIVSPIKSKTPSSISYFVTTFKLFETDSAQNLAQHPEA